MWGHNSTTYGHICRTPTMTCLCTVCHASLYDYTNNHLLPSQGLPQNPVNNPLNPIFHDIDQEPMFTNEIDSWLLLNSDQNFNQYQGQFNPQGILQVNHHGNYSMMEQQQQQKQQQQQVYDFSRASFDNTPAKILNVSLPAIVPEITPVSYSNTVDWSVDEFSFLPFHPGNVKEEAVGSNSKSTSLSSEGKLQQIDASNKPFKFPPMSRQDRVLRYFEKKKTRKYEKKLIKYSSRKTYAQTRPRIRGRFASRTQVDAQ